MYITIDITLTRSERRVNAASTNKTAMKILLNTERLVNMSF